MSARETATDRLGRLLSLVPWVASHPDGVSVQSVCSRFGLTEIELARDIDTVMMVGIYPFTPDMMIEAWISDGIVQVLFADAFARPLRLTPDEAVGLLAAASGLSTVPGADTDGPIQRALSKLEAVVGGVGTNPVAVDFGGAEGDVFTALSHAREARCQIEIDYPDATTGEVHARTIEPFQLFSKDGRWYASGWCHHAQDVRLFRVDRIVAARPSDAPFVHEAEESDDTFGFDESLPQVEIEVDRDAAWLLDSVPVLERTVDARRVRVRLAIGSPRWLARLVLQLGESARIIDADPALGLAELVEQEAQAILASYAS